MRRNCRRKNLGNGDDNSMTIIRPQQQPAYWLVNDGEHTGMTLTTELTGVSNGLPVVYGEGEQNYLNAVAASDYTPPALPDSGWLELGAVYTWNAQIVMVRQAHERTIYPPDQTPALFLFQGDGVNWIVGEQVYIGTRRDYEGVTYECIQAHVTQADWTPPAVPALWRVYVPTPPPGEEWQPYTAYVIGDEVTYNGILYRCRQAHTSLPGWEPPNVPALWLLI